MDLIMEAYNSRKNNTSNSNNSNNKIITCNTQISRLQDRRNSKMLLFRCEK